MDPSIKLARFTIRREGIVLVPYRDGAGFSIGCGHYLGEMPKPPNIKVTIQEAMQKVPQHLMDRADAVRKAIKVTVTQSQFDALLDLYYQGGSDGLEACCKFLNDRVEDDKMSCLTSDRLTAIEMLRWDTSADGTHMPGLLKRRGRNVAMFLAEEYGSDLDQVPCWSTVDPVTYRPRMKDMTLVPVSDEDLEP